MNATNTRPGDSQSAARLSQLLEQLKASRKVPEFSYGYWRAWVIAVGFGIAAFFQGHDTLFIYLGILSVIVFMHDSSERRAQRQIDLIADLIEELKSQKI